MPRHSQIGLYAKQPVSRKYLQENSGQLLINLLPQVKYHCVDWSLPGLTGASLPQSTPFRERPVHGTKLTFTPLQVTFLVDQNMANYLEIFNWMIGNSPPRTPEQARTWLGGQHSSMNNFNAKGAYCDASLILFTTQENPNIEVAFTDLFPISLGALTGTSTTQTARELTCTATFDYKDFDFVQRSLVK